MPQHEQHPTTAAPRRAVVTGSAGFIGSHLTHALVQAGTTVIGVDRRDPSTDAPAAANLSALHGLPGYVHVTADLLNCAIDPLLLDADAVFHLAGVPGVRPYWGPQFIDYLAANVLATHRVQEACTRIGVQRLVVASSSSVYGPTDGGASVEADQSAAGASEGVIGGFARPGAQFRVLRRRAGEPGRRWSRPPPSGRCRRRRPPRPGFWRPGSVATCRRRPRTTATSA
ncbi:NAD-dependent epimerase/dehydratase family protein [Streptomyces sp. NPDC005151]